MLCRNEQSAAFMAAGGLGRRPLEGPRLVQSVQSRPAAASGLAGLAARLLDSMRRQMAAAKRRCAVPPATAALQVTAGARGAREWCWSPQVSRLAANADASPASGPVQWHLASHVASQRAMRARMAHCGCEAAARYPSR